MNKQELEELRDLLEKYKVTEIIIAHNNHWDYTIQAGGVQYHIKESIPPDYQSELLRSFPYFYGADGVRFCHYCQLGDFVFDGTPYENHRDDCPWMNLKIAYEGGWTE